MSRHLAELRRLVEERGSRNEVACARLLKRFASVLIPAVRSRLYEIGTEINTRRGRCDLVVFATEYLNDTETRRVAYVWELKAPQCRAFLPDGRNRARPSDDLYAAENQLIQYTKSLRSDREWLIENNIVAEQDVRVGGVIIGRKDSPSAAGLARHTIRVARRAREIRDEFFYRGQLLLWDWDHVLWSAERLPVSRQAISGTFDEPQAGNIKADRTAANRALKLTVGRRRPPAA